VRFAIAVALASALLFVAAVPFARQPLGQVWPFIPAYQSALVVSDLVTAALLFGQLLHVRSRAILLLAYGYVFTAIMAVIHALTFPGLFAPTASSARDRRAPRGCTCSGTRGFRCASWATAS
jgi:hypothetical protein